MPHAQDREELGRCLPTFPPTFRRGRHRARRSRAAGLRDAHPAPAANQDAARLADRADHQRVPAARADERLLAMAVFASESNSWTPSAHIVESYDGKRVLHPT